MNRQRGQVSTITIALLVVGLVVGAGGGYFAASSSLQPKIVDYESQIVALETEIPNLEGQISTLGARVEALQKSSEDNITMEEYCMQVEYVIGRLYEADPEYAEAFLGYFEQAEKPGALSLKEKELISLAIGVVTHCPYCIAFHVMSAIEAGATREEIYEAGLVAGFMGGAPAIPYLKYLFDASDEFLSK
jgi:AhpD family alkylhydroperoxidase